MSGRRSSDGSATSTGDLSDQGQQQQQGQNQWKRRCRDELDRTFRCREPGCTRRYEAWRSLQRHLKADHDIKARKSEYASEESGGDGTTDPSSGNGSNATGDQLPWAAAADLASGDASQATSAGPRVSTTDIKSATKFATPPSHDSRKSGNHSPPPSPLRKKAVQEQRQYSGASGSAASDADMQDSATVYLYSTITTTVATTSTAAVFSDVDSMVSDCSTKHTLLSSSSECMLDKKPAHTGPTVRVSTTPSEASSTSNAKSQPSPLRTPQQVQLTPGTAMTSPQRQAGAEQVGASSLARQSGLYIQEEQQEGLPSPTIQQLQGSSPAPINATAYPGTESEQHVGNGQNFLLRSASMQAGMTAALPFPKLPSAAAPFQLPPPYQHGLPLTRHYSSPHVSTVVRPTGLGARSQSFQTSPLAEHAVLLPGALGTEGHVLSPHQVLQQHRQLFKTDAELDMLLRYVTGQPISTDGSQSQLQRLAAANSAGTRPQTVPRDNRLVSGITVTPPSAVAASLAGLTHQTLRAGLVPGFPSAATTQTHPHRYAEPTMYSSARSMVSMPPLAPLYNVPATQPSPQVPQFHVPRVGIIPSLSTNVDRIEDQETVNTTTVQVTENFAQTSLAWSEDDLLAPEPDVSQFHAPEVLALSGLWPPNTTSTARRSPMQDSRQGQQQHETQKHQNRPLQNKAHGGTRR